MDKVYHITISAVMVIVFACFMPLWLAGMLALLVGISKECYDLYIRNNRFDPEDLFADIVGITIGGVLWMLCYSFLHLWPSVCRTCSLASGGG